MIKITKNPIGAGRNNARISLDQIKKEISQFSDANFGDGQKDIASYLFAIGAHPYTITNVISHMKENQK
jgi:hypothetical protein